MSGHRTEGQTFRVWMHGTVSAGIKPCAPLGFAAWASSAAIALDSPRADKCIRRPETRWPVRRRESPCAGQRQQGVRGPTTRDQRAIKASTEAATLTRRWAAAREKQRSLLDVCVSGRCSSYA